WTGVNAIHRAGEAIVRVAETQAQTIEVAPGARPGLTRPLASTLLDVVAAPPRAKLGWTDVARFGDLGIPAVNFGPGDPLLCHKNDEHVDTRAITQCYDTLVTWLHGSSVNVHLL